MNEKYTESVLGLYVWFGDGKAAKIDQIISVQLDNENCDPGCTNLSIKNGRIRELDNENNPWLKAFLYEHENKNLQSIGWMAAMSAIMVRIQRGYTIEQLREYIDSEQQDYSNWFRKEYETKQ